MTIQLSPEMEEMIREDVNRGAYGSVEEYVAHAVGLLHAQESWIASHRAEITAQIEEGWLASERGELFDGDTSRVQLAERKREWLAKHPAK
jgi:putative addiction module CopG family antidote